MKKRNVFLAVAASAALGFAVVGAQAFNVQGSATEQTVDYGKYFVLDGAGIRVKANDNNYNGIRFDAILDGEIYQTLEAMETETVSVDYGMIVAPMSYAEANPYTKDNLFGAARKYYVDGVTEAGEGLTKLGGAHVATLKDATDENGNVVGKLIRGVIHNISEDQITREFIGVPYICITTGEDKAYYVADYQASDARSMVYVAQLAYADEDNGLSSEANEYLNSYYLTKAADKSYTYTVEHIGITPTGEEVTLEKEVGEKTKLGTTVTATDKAFAGYTFNQEKSTLSDIVYANNRTALKVYYTQDHIDVQLNEYAGTQVTVTAGGGKTYALTSETKYTFTVTPPEDYNYKTQILVVFVNDVRLYTEKEGTFTFAISNYENLDEIVINVGINDYEATPTEDIRYDYATVEKVTDGEFAGAWKYSNTSGGQLSNEWGNSGLYFSDVYHPVQGDEVQTFYAKGFKYIKLQVYFTDSVTSFNVRQHTGQGGTNSLNQVGFGTALPTSPIVSFGDGENVACEYLQKNMWYTMYIEPTRGNVITLYSNGGSVETPAVIYVKNISYETEKPNYTVTLVPYSAKEASYLQIGQTEFNGEMVWEYVNVHGGRNGNPAQYGKAGLCFKELTHNATAGFFGKEYNYIKLDFYVTESVQQIDFKPDYQGKVDHNVWEQYTIGYNFNDAFKTSEMWMFYDMDGNRVTTKLVHNTWYTVWILATDVAYPQMMIQTSGTVTETSAPTMYLKNISYEKTK